MPMYIDTRGRSKIAIGICGRCSTKVPYDSLVEDGNYQGLYVCNDGCRDPIDPWRLPAAPTEDITLEHSRPDVSIAAGGPMDIFVNPLQAVLAAGGNVIGSGDGSSGIAIAPPVAVIQQPPVQWTPNTEYPLGYQVTPINPVGQQDVGLLIPVFTCIVPGQSGAAAPAWTNAGEPATVVEDNQVIWFNAGLYLP